MTTDWSGWRSFECVFLDRGACLECNQRKIRTTGMTETHFYYICEWCGEEFRIKIDSKEAKREVL